ncbi:hypothetical protein ACFU9B_43965 [Streptomyces sp. NPDC057592]|uniref:hypothetical protein n=1 Tax=unclassified Streptomyces TaxID=2593676 RepID=UPI00368B5C0C
MLNSEALVGIIGAGSAMVGAVLGAAGAVVAGRFQAAAVRYQTDVQQRHEHEQWLREGLRERYLEVAEAITPALQKHMEAQGHIATGQRDQARDALLSIDASVVKRHRTAIRAEAPPLVVQVFVSIDRFFWNVEESAQNCTDPSICDRDIAFSLLAQASSLLEASMEFSRAVRSTLRPEEEGRPHRT